MCLCPLKRRDVSSFVLLGVEVMDTKLQILPNTIIQQQQQETLSKQSNNENSSQPAASAATPNQSPPPLPPQPPKIKVLLPKHAALKLRDLVQKRDMALLKLGIISVQFEDDQIIPLTLNATNSNQPTKHQQQQTIAQLEPAIIESSIETCNADVDCLNELDTTITTSTGLTPSPNRHSTIIEEDEDLDMSNMNWSMFDLI